ncbi:HepT-like ribonuclease domain-containing protein [Methanoculleus methanifontis]|uniref:HepT-like ribonuclease domain-containing protein n=1 Tax=Methanoculleus methanifontis TaxID=2584086 RepID=UPI003461C249
MEHAGFNKAVIHHYFGVDLETIWFTIKRQILKLQALLAATAGEISSGDHPRMPVPTPTQRGTSRMKEKQPGNLALRARIASHAGRPADRRGKISITPQRPMSYNIYYPVISLQAVFYLHEQSNGL